MPVAAQTMGPGTFSIGLVGTPLDLTAQVTSLKVTPSAEAEDSLTTLSGESLAGERTYTWTVSGTLIQDLTEDGMFDYTWSNAGDQVPFTFTPSTAAGRDITGTLIVDPLEIGGDVKQKNTVDFEWAVVGQPVLGAAL
jgi:hypothetical protein